MSAEHDLAFGAMGGEVRLIVGVPLLASAPGPAEAAERERAYVQDFGARLSRFRADSELSALNGDPSDAPRASALLRSAVAAGVWAAQRSGGLVDPTLLAEIEAAGYASSRANASPASLAQALRAAPARRPARAHPARAWEAIELTRDGVRRPPGLRIDTGGTGKGLCADAVAHRLRRHSRYVVDCGGDLAIGGPGAALHPIEVEVEHPLTGEIVQSLRVSSGGVASSGLNVRIWRTADGCFAHHLLDPASGRPAWTGLVGATALAPSALEAETLAKTALLLGPHGARRVLARYGGIAFHEDGDVELISLPPAAVAQTALHPATPRAYQRSAA